MASANSSQYESAGHPSRNNSPASSLHKQAPQLETLIVHLLASKKSLSSIHQAQRATNILSKARSYVEETAILAARTAFLRQSLASQLKLLRGIQYHLENIVHTSQAEFSSVLKELDVAGKRLQKAVQRLKSTKIEPGFRSIVSKTSGAIESENDPKAKESLHDFVDDAPVEELKNSIKASIDEVQDAKRYIETSLQGFEDALQAVNDAMGGGAGGVETTTSSSSSSNFQPPNIPNTIRALETDAREVAESLESLVKHFDLCVTAIRHTEGGGAAVAKNLDAHELPEGVSVNDFSRPAQSITEDERTEMMAVLETDAAEVEEVVVEIHLRISQMEGHLDRLLLWNEKQESENEQIILAVKLLEQVGAKIPIYINQTHEFATRWNEEKLKIEDGMAGLEDLRDVYRNFLGAYDGLIVEVARRRAVRVQMEEIIRDAHGKLQRLYQDDTEEREAFRLDHGEFLPIDIWPGLSDLPSKYSFARVGEESENEPDLPRKAVEEALKRLKAASPLP